jgi:chorismate mutase/prephenate dehydratase
MKKNTAKVKKKSMAADKKPVSKNKEPGMTDIREKIDQIDIKLIKLLNQRASLGIDIAKVKEKTGAPIFLPARENQILKKIIKVNKGPLSNSSLAHVFREIFSGTRAVEKTLKVSCLGPAGSFSHLAALRLFGQSSVHMLSSGIDMVFTNVERGTANFGLVPIENTIEGTVGQTLDLFIDSPVKIISETYYEIHLNLLSNVSKLDKIKTLYTHYMPLGQCRGWITRNIPSAKVVPTASSADAAINAKKTPNSASIGAHEAARIYGLKVLAERIEERQGNQTRFLVISMQDSPASGNDKTSIMFSTKDVSGALSNVLRPFATKGVNLSKIQSRPSPGKDWEYVFFADFTGHLDDPRVKWVMNKVKLQTSFLKSLGSYPAGRVD